MGKLTTKVNELLSCATAVFLLFFMCITYKGDVKEKSWFDKSNLSILKIWFEESSLPLVSCNYIDQFVV